MLISRCSSTVFLRELNRNLQIHVEKINEDLTTSVSVVYRHFEKQEDGIDRLKLKSYSEKEILFGILISHELPEETQAVIKIKMEEVINHRVSDLLDRELFLAFLSEKHYLLEYILNSSRFFTTTEEFFGWLREEHILKYYFHKKVDYKFINNPINHSRRRGYRDQGSMGLQFNPSTEWKEDYLNRLWEEKREELLEITKDTISIIIGSLM